MKRLRRMKKLASAAIFLMVSTLAFPFIAPPVQAQATTGGLRGVVTNPNGEVITDADVVAKNVATGVENTTKSNDEGIYAFPRLLPGIYTLTVEKQGFRRQEFQDVNVQTGKDVVIDATLQAGNLTETVTVTAAGEELLQKENVQVSNTFESRKVSELPTNIAGGGIDTLALLTPGVVPGLGFSNSNGAEFSVNGARGRSNNFNIDGQDNNDLSVAGPGFFVDNPDIVGEFQIITNNFSAEFGRNQGAIVNIVTKSGTNEFHGSGFWFHRDRANFDTMTNIERRTNNNGLNHPDPLLRNVVGGTFGGPVIKDRAFFFGSIQKIWERDSATLQSTTPAIAAEELSRLESLPGFATNPILQTLRNFSAFAITDFGVVSERTDFPQDETVTIGGQRFRVAYPQRVVSFPLNAPEYSLRGDVKITDKHSVWWRHLWQRSDNKNAGAGSGGFTRDTPARTWHSGGQVTSQISNTSVNEFRIAFSDLSVIFGGGCEGLKGCIPHPDNVGQTFPNITFTGFRSSGGANLQTIGGATNLPQGRVVKVSQFADNFSKTMGRHQFKMGVDIRRLTNTVPFLPNVAGAFRFPSANSILQNRPSFVNLAAGPLSIDYNETDQFYYFQDDWRVRDNLTLNLGLRYEYTGQPINTLHDLTLERESNPETAVWRQNLPLEARIVPKTPGDKNNFAPRIGFAWRPRFGGSFGRMLFGEQDSTVISGGYSIAYDPAFHNILLNVSTAAPTVFLFSVTNPATGAVTFPLPANPISDTVQDFARSNNLIAVNTFDPKFFNQTIVSPDFHSPYAEQWSLRVQREISRNNVFEARYVGTHGVGLFQTTNGNPLVSRLTNGFTLGGIAFPAFPNLVPPGVTPLTCVNNPATPDNEGVCNGRVLNRGQIRVRENSAQSIYHGLQLRYDGRAFNQLTVGMSYAFQKALDNTSEIFSANESAVAQSYFNITAAERGYSGFDRRHVYALNFLWDIPGYRSQEGFLGRVLGGWQINGLYFLSSGQRFTAAQYCNALCIGNGYEDVPFAQGFVGIDNFRPFYGNPNAPADQVGINQIDAAFIWGTDIIDPRGFYSYNDLNTSGGTDVNVVSLDEVRYVFNGPGAAQVFGTPFGNVPRNTEIGPRLNNLNLGIFKNIRVAENWRVQFRAEMFNALNHPNPGVGIISGDSIPGIFVDDAGTLFNRKDEMEFARRSIQLGLRITF